MLNGKSHYSLPLDPLLQQAPYMQYRPIDTLLILHSEKRSGPRVLFNYAVIVRNLVGQKHRQAIGPVLAVLHRRLIQSSGDIADRGERHIRRRQPIGNIFMQGPAYDEPVRREPHTDQALRDALLVVDGQHDQPEPITHMTQRLLENAERFGVVIKPSELPDIDTHQAILAPTQGSSHPGPSVWIIDE